MEGLQAEVEWESMGTNVYGRGMLETSINQCKFVQEMLRAQYHKATRLYL